jgi:serine/threonine protein kinase
MGDVRGHEDDAKALARYRRCRGRRRIRQHSSIAGSARRRPGNGSGRSVGGVARGSGDARPAHIKVQSRYRLGQLLGSGGLGDVYRATRFGAEGFERTVALKRIRPELAQQERFVRMFIREAQLLGRLIHRNIVSAWDFERDAAGQLFLVMEYVDGVDLDKLLKSGTLPHAVIIFIVAEILNGLDYAHRLPTGQSACGVVHRDLSPHNILLSWEGAVKIADFGLAKSAQSTHVSASLDLQGKVAFMSPEQAACRPLDGRSDLFSVGIMLWEMLTGERLFAREQEGATATIWRVLTDWVVRPSVFRPVASDLEAVVLRLLDRDPSERYPTAHATRDALLRCRDASKLACFELERLLASRFPQMPERRAPRPLRTFALEPRHHTLTPPLHLRLSAMRARTPRSRLGKVLAVAVGVLVVGLGILAVVWATHLRAAAKVTRAEFRQASAPTSSGALGSAVYPRAEGERR